MKMFVSFEADDGDLLVEAVENLLVELRKERLSLPAMDGWHTSDAGWRYQVGRIKENEG